MATRIMAAVRIMEAKVQDKIMAARIMEDKIMVLKIPAAKVMEVKTRVPTIRVAVRTGTGTRAGNIRTMKTRSSALQSTVALPRGGTVATRIQASTTTTGGATGTRNQNMVTEITVTT